VRPETCRGKRNPDTVYRQKRILYQVGNKHKINYTEMHGQQNIKKYATV
jgi:hypothetical protein